MVTVAIAALADVHVEGVFLIASQVGVGHEVKSVVVPGREIKTFIEIFKHAICTLFDANFASMQSSLFFYLD